MLFYKYTDIEDPKAETERQRAVLSVLGIKGRFIVANEGINGTGEGTAENIQKYIDWMNSQKMYKRIHWKLSQGTGNAFPKLSVKARKEIVSLHLADDLNPNQITGTHLKPEELHNWFNEGKEFYIVDMRNDYELKSGKFENTIFPGLRNFRDLNQNIEKIKNLKDKTVLTVCTGGIRCEKASGFLKREGFNKVYQLDGGIVSYMSKYPGQNYKGSLYVFDGRETIHFDGGNHEIIGVCDFCENKTENYSNCANKSCNLKLLVCNRCATESLKFCEECKVDTTTSYSKKYE